MRLELIPDIPGRRTPWSYGLSIIIVILSGFLLVVSPEARELLVMLVVTVVLVAVVPYGIGYVAYKVKEEVTTDG